MSIKQMKIMLAAEMRLLRLVAGYRTAGQKPFKRKAHDNIVLKAIKTKWLQHLERIKTESLALL
jgi:hypothetical protein